MRSFENENIKFIKELTSALAYYKLLYIGIITKEKSIDAFKMLGAESYFNKLIEEDKEGNISLESTNLYMIKKFNDLMKIAKSGRVSLSNIVVNDINNLGWLGEIVDNLDPNEKLKDSICNNCSYEVYDKIFSSKILVATVSYKKRVLENECDSILKLSKKNN